MTLNQSTHSLSHTVQFPLRQRDAESRNGDDSGLEMEHETRTSKRKPKHKWKHTQVSHVQCCRCCRCIYAFAKRWKQNQEPNKQSEKKQSPTTRICIVYRVVESLWTTHQLSNRNLCVQRLPCRAINTYFGTMSSHSSPFTQTHSSVRSESIQFCFCWFYFGGKRRGRRWDHFICCVNCVALHVKSILCEKRK